MKKLSVKITFVEPILGTWPANPNIARDYIASNSPDASTIEEEVAALGAEAVADKGMTVFPRDENGTPVLYDYQIKGFFKDACGMLRKVSGSESAKIRAYKKEIDGLIFVKERKIPITEAGESDLCQRPLRGSTPQGERIALASSEAVPEGSYIEFTIQMMVDDHEKVVREWLDYGEFRGMGQWRNSGKGRFSYEVLAD